MTILCPHSPQNLGGSPTSFAHPTCGRMSMQQLLVDQQLSRPGAATSRFGPPQPLRSGYSWGISPRARPVKPENGCNTVRHFQRCETPETLTQFHLPHKTLAPGGGIEPPLTDSKSAVLPLDDPGSCDTQPKAWGGRPLHKPDIHISSHHRLQVTLP